MVDDNLEAEELRDLFKARLTLAGPVVGEDEKAWRKAVNRRLAQAGFELEFAADGDDALARYRESGPYDLVLTDLYHPGLNGVELARAVRRENPAQAIAVFTAGNVPDSFMEVFWNLNIPVGHKLGAREALLQLVEDAVARNGERLAGDQPGTLQ